MYGSLDVWKLKGANDNGFDFSFGCRVSVLICKHMSFVTWTGRVSNDNKSENNMKWHRIEYRNYAEIQ